MRGRAQGPFRYSEPVALTAFREAFPGRKCKACPCPAAAHKIITGTDVVCSVCKTKCAHVFGAGEFEARIMRWAQGNQPLPPRPIRPRCNCENKYCSMPHDAGACDELVDENSTRFVMLGRLCDGCARHMPASYRKGER